jgi:hypothetical protein
LNILEETHSRKRAPRGVRELPIGLRQLLRQREEFRLRHLMGRWAKVADGL